MRGKKKGRRKIVTSIYLTPKQVKWSKAEAKKRGTTQAEVIRSALDEAAETSRYVDAHVIVTAKHDRPAVQA